MITATYRQKLLHLLFINGLSITSKDFDKTILLINNFEMPLSDRHKWCYDNFHYFMAFLIVRTQKS